MTQRKARRVTVTREITYHPPGTLAWYRRFPEGFSGVVTDQQHAFLMANGAAVDDAPADDLPPVDDLASEAEGDAQ